MLAQASSTGTQYGTEVPDVPSETKPPKKNSSAQDPNAGTSNKGDYTAPNPQTGGDGESSEVVGGGQGSGNGNGDGAKAGKDGGTGQGSPGNGSKAGGETGLSEQRQVAPASSTSDDGSSSPLVPILIAVAALAAISIGAVVARQRRQRGGPGGEVSPKAS